jgi:endo-1,4-beta-D-glucanase Y
MTTECGGIQPPHHRQDLARAMPLRDSARLGASITLMWLIASSASAVSAQTATSFRWPYNQPTTIQFDVAHISQAWRDWKSAQITTADAGGNGRLRVLGGVDKRSTVSEGQGYGILFASILDDQATLDGLWLFTADHLNGNGLMDWHIGSPGQRLGSGAATDADADIALGLVNACVKLRQGAWPASPRGIDYCTLATATITAIYQHEVDKPGSAPRTDGSSSRGHELLPGDRWAPAQDYPEGLVNLSYFSPGYFSVFGKFTGNEAAWEAVNQRNYEIVNLVQAKPDNCSRLVPNWNTYDGDPQWVPTQPNNYAWWSYDAARIAWRIAVDRRWYGRAEARETMNEIGGFFSSVGFGGIGEHSLNGQKTGSGPWPFFVANAATAVWAADSATPVTCGAATGSLKETPQSAYDRVLNTKDTPNSYYGNAWRLFAMLVMTGNFPNLYEMTSGRG